MTRDAMLRRLEAHDRLWDMVIVGGGATGAGIAVDAASRGYDVLLVEQFDFGKGTSSRSTKLVHGGVRYLEQGNVSLVIEALKERGTLRQNAPHLVHDLAFIVPSYIWWESPFYGLGLKLYDLLSGRYRFGQTRRLSKDETLELLPTIRTEGLRGGVVYYDGQFDDSRLLINLVTTAAEQGATIVNYVRAVGLTKDADSYVNGVALVDQESGRDDPRGRARRRQRDRCLLRRPAADGRSRCQAHGRAEPGHASRVRPHLPAGRQRDHGAPHDRRPRDVRDPVARAHAGRHHRCPRGRRAHRAACGPTRRSRCILETAGRYLERPPTRADILSVFAGIRPLVRAGDATNTAALSRDHTVHIDRSGLLTIAGGKWTTYRNMAEDCVNQAATLAELEERPCITRTLQHPRLPPERREVRRAVALRIRCAGHSEPRAQRSGTRRAAPSRSPVHGG